MAAAGASCSGRAAVIELRCQTSQSEDDRPLGAPRCHSSRHAGGLQSHHAKWLLSHHAKELGSEHWSRSQHLGDPW